VTGIGISFGAGALLCGLQSSKTAVFSGTNAELPEQGEPDAIYVRIRTQLSERETSDLTFFAMSINAWNRINVGFKTVPGPFDASFRLDGANLK
jgi:hypothetical protein